MRAFLRRRIVSPLLALLTQGFAPREVALGVALGAGVGIFPVLGVSTPALTALAVWLRLSLPAVQAVNYALAPLKIALIIPFVRVGEWVTGAAPQALSTQAGLKLIAAGAMNAVIVLRDAIVHAAIGWMIIGPPLIYVLYRLFLPVFEQARIRAGLPLPRDDPHPMNDSTLSTLTQRWLEQDKIPDWLIRRRIRELSAMRLRREDKGDPESQQAHFMSIVQRLRESPIAIHTDEANQQHYEVPSEFYLHTLGKHLKYSCCYFDDFTIEQAAANLDAAEARMLWLTCERAKLRNGERVLELGCGWGSLSLWMAERYPDSRITAISNSRTQKLFIDTRAAERGLKNLEVITCDVNQLYFGPEIRFDRVVSVEMFEHMRNYESLLARIAGWMTPEATLFVHIFTHHRFAYTFEVRDDDDWMARYFFAGGIMPSDHLLHYFQRHLRMVDHWHVDGRQYQLTAEAWLQKMTAHRDALMPVLVKRYGEDEALKWWVYWRVFFMSCAETFGYRGGREWLVSHYLLERR